MIIQAYSCLPLSTNAYVVICLATRKAAVIDPAHESTPLIIECLKEKEASLEKIFLTHSHWDHIADVANLKKQIDVPVYVHPLDRGNLEKPGSDRLPLMMQITGVPDALSFEDGDVISVGELNFRVIHTPGHSPGGVCLYCEEKGVLFSGDTLFKGSIGTLSLPTGHAPSMWASLKKLSLLPPETKVYPGHGVRTKIQKESWLVKAEKVFGS